MKRERRQVTLEELGRAIKARREEKGLSLQNVADITKIRIHFIEYIENGHFEKFHGIVYARGFVRSVLKVIESEDLWEYYKPLLYDAPGRDEKESKLTGACTPPTRGFKPASRFWVILILLFTVVGTGWYAWFSWKEGGLNIEQVAQGGGGNNGAIETSVVSEDIKSGDVKSEDLIVVFEGVVSPDAEKKILDDGEMAEETAEAPEPIPQFPTLEIEGTGACWLKVRTKEATIHQGILEKGQKYTLEVKEEVTVTYGRASDVQVTWNGEELGRPGSGGRVVHIFYSSDGKTGRVN